MDSDKFLSLGGPLPRLEIFPGLQEISETPSPQMGCFALLIPRSRWTRDKRVWGRQCWGSFSKALSATMEYLNVESEDIVYKAMVRLEHAQDKLPWTEEIQTVG